MFSYLFSVCKDNDIPLYFHVIISFTESHNDPNFDKCKPFGRSICKNGGSCYIAENSDNDPKCSCIEGYSGLHCETGNLKL